eukprot:GHVS01082227.1.p1 GENE.GHVS01082227.1~~GHVS01082227.1.p1  ORF type:complete len:116 (+),score=19.25 GHVS01082227.1:26-349(+)
MLFLSCCCCHVVVVICVQVVCFALCVSWCCSHGCYVQLMRPVVVVQGGFADFARVTVEAFSCIFHFIAFHVYLLADALAFVGLAMNTLITDFPPVAVIAPVGLVTLR